MDRIPVRRISCVAVSCAFLALLSSAASAATYSFNDNFSFPLSPGNTVVNLPLWDPSAYPGEVLTLVELTLDGTVSANVTAENDSAIAGNMGVNLTGFMSGTATGLSATPLFAVAGGPVPVAATDGIAGSGPDFHDFGVIADSQSDTDSTGAVGAYIGVGTFPVSILGNGGFAVSGVTDSNLTISSFGGSGIATVTYHTTIIPEPSSIVLGMFGACAAALAVWRRRRSK